MKNDPQKFPQASVSVSLSQRFTARLSEALPGGRNRRLAVGIASGVFTKGMAFLFTLVTVPMTLYYLGPERYGIWVTMISMLAWISMVDLGVANGLTPLLSAAFGKGREDLAREYVTTAFWSLLRTMGLEAIYQKPNTSKPNPEHKVYPYLLRGLVIDRCDQVWSTDITYVRLASGFVYLVAVIDWYSRYVLGWALSTTLDADFCIETVGNLLEHRKCEIFNTDQGSQFTTPRFTQPLLDKGVKVSMDGRGRALDNIFVERLWRTVKYEHVYLQDIQTVQEAWSGLRDFFLFYNNERFHQSLDYRTPAQIYLGEHKDEQDKKEKTSFYQPASILIS